MVYDLKQFTFDKQYRTLVAELSDLGRLSIPPRCFAIKSNFSNRTEWFSFVGVDKNSDGETAGWRFKPYSDLVNVAEVLIIND